MSAVSVEAISDPPADADAAIASARSGQKFLASGMLLAANVIEAILPLIRNIALARLMQPDEFGLAISLAVVLGVLEVLTDFGLPVFAVRKTNILSTPEAMGTLHSLALIRATILGLILVAVSPLVARMFGSHVPPENYALLGLIAFARGFENLGVKEMMRQFAFKREALVICCAQTLGLAVTIAFAAATGSMMAMIWGMLTTTITTVLLSHVLAPQPYRLHWDKRAVKEAAGFGWPLLVNGVAVSLTMCDRLMIGAVLGPAVLALYNIAYGTSTLPRSVLARFMTSAFLPHFVEQRDGGGPAGSNILELWIIGLSALSLFYGLTLGLLGDRLLAIVFGPAYQPSRLFMCIAGMNVCVKFLMLLTTPAAYASGTTKFVTYGSLLSAASIIPAFGVLLIWRNMELFLFVATFVEIGALIFVGQLAVSKLQFPQRLMWSAIALPVTLLTLTAAVAFFNPSMTQIVWSAVCLGVLGVALLGYLTLYRLAILNASGRATGQLALGAG